jgi:hypothetical protein
MAWRREGGRVGGTPGGQMRRVLGPDVTPFGSGPAKGGDVRRERGGRKFPDTYHEHLAHTRIRRGEILFVELQSPG